MIGYAKELRAIDRASGALLAWINDQRIQAEHRHPDADFDNIVGADETYAGHIKAWGTAVDALADVRRRIAAAEAETP